jgi:hypothetical protein
VRNLLGGGVPALVLATLISAGLGAQSISPEAQTHIDAAKAAAASDHMGLFTPPCDGAIALAKPPAPRGGGAGRGGGGRGGGPAPPARDTWHAEPVKVFDNVRNQAS